MDPFHRRFPLYLGLLTVGSYALLAQLGADGAPLIVAVFALLLPTLLRPIAGVMRRERLGVLFVFLVAAYAEVIDDVWRTPQRVSMAILVLGVLYLVERRETALEVLLSPPALLLGLFLGQQVASGFLLGAEDPGRVLQNRASVFLALLAAAVMARRPGGARLLGALAVVAALMSVPVMLRELANPDLLAPLVSTGPITVADTRSGGLFSQANNAGIALTFALAFALGLRLRRPTLATVVVALGVGVVCTASRGAFAVLLVLLVLAALAARLRSSTRRQFALTLVGLALGLALLQPACALAVRATSPFVETVPAIARLQEVLLLGAGSSQALADDDSRRVDTATEAWRMIGERPLFGRGTGNFVIPDLHGDLRSHVQFLEVLGENGVVGGALYAAFLVAVGFAAWRSPRRLRFATLLVLVAWLMTHFDNHNLMEYRFMTLPLALAFGLAGAVDSEVATPGGADRTDGANAVAA